MMMTMKMAAKINWHRYGTTLRQCHRMCIAVLRFRSAEDGSSSAEQSPANPLPTHSLPLGASTGTLHLPTRKESVPKIVIDYTINLFLKLPSEFLPRDAVSVCVCHKLVFYRNGWTNRAGFWQVSFLPSVLHCVKNEIRLSPKIRALPSGTLF